MELMEIMQHRRSVRTYVPGAVTEEQLQAILQAGLLSPTGKGLRPWVFLVVRDPAMLQSLSRRPPAPSWCWATGRPPMCGWRTAPWPWPRCT